MCSERREEEDVWWQVARKKESRWQAGEVAWYAHGLLSQALAAGRGSEASKPIVSQNPAVYQKGQLHVSLARLLELAVLTKFCPQPVRP